MPTKEKHRAQGQTGLGSVRSARLPDFSQPAHLTAKTSRAAITQSRARLAQHMDRWSNLELPRSGPIVNKRCPTRKEQLSSTRSSTPEKVVVKTGGTS